MSSTSTESAAYTPPVALSKHSLKLSLLLNRAVASGLLLPLGFAPFHMPGFAILSLALLFLQLRDKSSKAGFLIGFVFSCAAFALGVSWVYVSIHNYGQLNIPSAALITLLFITVFSVYTGILGFIFSKFHAKLPNYITPLFFSSLWFFSEYIRAINFTGFSWLLVGTGQMDAPLKHLLPIIGVFGVSWVAALAAACLALSLIADKKQKLVWLFLFVLLLVAPSLLAHIEWTQKDEKPLSIASIQADLSMRNKWDEALYLSIRDYYQKAATSLIPENNLVVLPEAAIPMPTSYATDFLDNLHSTAKHHDSAVLLGMPHPDRNHSGHYYNALISTGLARGVYAKQHLVPFGEYVPKPFKSIVSRLNLPEPRMAAGTSEQSLVHFAPYDIATLICYETAFPNLLRAQLPKANFIVSISDDGWFGRSLAIYQHLQMAQTLSKQTGRFQVVSNNSGLSSLIDTSGNITDTLPAFKQGVLKGKIYAATGETPWVKTGDTPIVFINLSILLCIAGYLLMLAASGKRRYPNQPC